MNNGLNVEKTAKVAQAQGMVSVQAACAMAHALALMRDRAAVTGETVERIADAVLDRSLRFGE